MAPGTKSGSATSWTGQSLTFVVARPSETLVLRSVFAIEVRFTLTQQPICQKLKNRFYRYPGNPPNLAVIFLLFLLCTHIIPKSQILSLLCQKTSQLCAH